MGMKHATIMNQSLCDSQELSLLGNRKSRALRVVTLCVPLSSNIFMWLQEMNTRRSAASIVEEDLYNDGVSPQENQDPLEGNEVPL